MPPGDIAPVVVMSILVVCAAAVMILRGPLGRAIARRLEGADPDGATARHVARLEERVVDLEVREQRLAELEERLDFAERLLARQADAGRLAGGEGHR